MERKRRVYTQQRAYDFRETMTEITLSQLVELAKTAENKDPIDWGELLLDEDEVYRVFARSAYEIYTKCSPHTVHIVLLSSIIKLLVENFVLKQHRAALVDKIGEIRRDG